MFQFRFNAPAFSKPEFVQTLERQTIRMFMQGYQQQLAFLGQQMNMTQTALEATRGLWLPWHQFLSAHNTLADYNKLWQGTLNRKKPK